MRNKQKQDLQKKKTPKKLDMYEKVPAVCKLLQTLRVDRGVAPRDVVSQSVAFTAEPLSGRSIHVGKRGVEGGRTNRTS